MAPDLASSTPPQATLEDAIRYWELRRIGYNLALIVVAIAWIVLSWPHFRPAFGPESIPPLVVLAALANVCYCAAYLVEALVLHDSGFRETWRRRRWMLWLAGTLLALLIENYWIADEIYPHVPFVG